MSKSAAPESDHLAPIIPDRKHQTPPKAVVNFSPLVFHEEAAGNGVSGKQMVEQPGRWSVAKAKPINEFLMDLSLFQDLSRGRSFVGSQHFSEIGGRLLVKFKEFATLIGFPVPKTGFRRYGNPTLLSNNTDRFRKSYSFGEHHKVKYIATNLAAVAVEKLFVPMNCERWRLFSMEGTEALNGISCSL